jgi:quercetin dioxygenase-like cupin family protein
MNLIENHSIDKGVSAKPIFKGEGTTISLQILGNQKLAEHTTKIPAMLVCVCGEVVFEYVNGNKYELKSGDYINIEPNESHWVIAKVDSQLLLLK